MGALPPAIYNLAFFGVNTALTFGLGARGLLGAKTNSAVSAQFPTLCTPAGYAFAIWGPIFLLEGGSVLWHFVATKEDSAVLGSASSSWCAACALQAAWTAAFSFDQMALSVPLLVGIPMTLSRVYSATQEGLSHGAFSFLLGKLPFSLHYSWTAIASLVNMNLLAVKLDAAPSTQLGLGLLTQLAATAFGASESWRRCDPVPALVGSWALLAISANDGVAGQKIVSSAPQLSRHVDGLTSLARGCGRGLALLSAAVLARNVFVWWRRPPPAHSKAQ